jgi:membrane-bound lytic murein transglycosylase F
MYIGCTSQEDKERHNKKTLVKDTLHIVAAPDDSIKSQKTHKQPDNKTNLIQPKGKRSPIITTALKNTNFNAEKWLKSDYDFNRRTKLNRISEYDQIIKKMARRYGFDWRLIAAQIYTESNFKNKAKSHVGATGLMQIMPNTAKFMGFDPNTMIKPEINIAVGCMYNQRMYSLWKRQTKDYNRLAFALASYNAGRGRVLKSYSTKDALTTWDKVHPFLPEETQSYVHKIYLKHDLYSRYILP